MKSVLITFDQAHYVRIIELLDKLSCRGFSCLLYTSPSPRDA